jgi:S-formylglutathione hydrolase FrmB
MSMTPPRSRPRARLAAALALLAAAALTAAPAGAKPQARSRVEQRTFASAALGQQRHYRIYLPAGYDAAGPTRYPVVYVLHGLGGSDRDFFEQGRLHQHLDALIAADNIEPLIAVAADGDSGYWTNHLDRPAERGTRWGDYVARDLVAEVDAHFKTRAERDGRALAGVSMGGHGALSLALGHPDRFRAAVSLGGALFPTPPTHRPVYGRVWGTPADPAHWARTSPMALLAQLAKRDRKAPELYLQCGDADGLGFLPYAQAASKLLAEREIGHVLRVTRGGHNWGNWEPETRDWLRFLDAGFRVSRQQAP